MGSNDYVYALDYAIAIIEALDCENILNHVKAKYNISVLQDIKRIYDTGNLPK